MLRQRFCVQWRVNIRGKTFLIRKVSLNNFTSRIETPVSRDNPLNVLNTEPRQIENELEKRFHDLLLTGKNRQLINDCLRNILDGEFLRAFSLLGKLEAQCKVNVDHPSFQKRADLYISCLATLSCQLAFGKTCPNMETVSAAISSVSKMPVSVWRVVDMNELSLIKERFLIACTRICHENHVEKQGDETVLTQLASEKLRIDMSSFFRRLSLDSPHLLPSAYVIWPDVDVPAGPSYSETGSSEQCAKDKLQQFLNEDGTLSYSGFCQFIAAARFPACYDSSIPLYEIYDSLPESEKPRFMDSYLSFNSERQVLVEKYVCALQEPVKDSGKTLNQAISAFSSHDNIDWLNEWRHSLAKRLENVEANTTLSRFSCFFSVFSPLRLASFIITKMLRSTLLTGEVKVSKITHECVFAIRHLFASEKRASSLKHQFDILFPRDEIIKLCAGIMKAAIETCRVPYQKNNPPPAFSLEYLHTPNSSHYRRVGTIVIDGGVRKLFEKFHQHHLSDSYDLPMLCLPEKWVSPTIGGFSDNKTPFLISDHATVLLQYMKRAHKTGQLASVYEALTAMGECSWTVNRKMLHVFNDAMKIPTGFLSVPPPLASLHQDPPPLPKDSDYDDINQFKKDYLQCRRQIDSTKKILGETRALRQTFDLKHALVNALGANGDIFFLVHAIDFRGRAYPISSFLSHHSDDLSRSLLMFWEAKPLGANGLNWLKYQLANLHSKTKLTMAQSIEFVHQNKHNILDSAKTPFSSKWWTVADSPWQCLALCQEYLDICVFKGPISEFKSRIPVHQDGTCNGLQHYAALGRDEVAAKSVNLEPGERKADVYLDVLGVVKEKIEKDGQNGGKNAEIAQLALDVLTRKVLKQTVMTTVYGVTFYGAIRQIELHIPDVPLGQVDKRFDKISRLQLATYIATKVMEAISLLFSKARVIQDWLDKNCKRHLCAFDRESPQRMNFLNQQYNRPMMWTSLSGFPVIQPYRQMNLRAVKTALQDISFNQDHQFRNIDRSKQLNGVAPNFIHSLDAMHLQMVCLRARRSENLTFAAVHDSFWTHACDVDLLSKIIREEFVRLHNSEVLENLRDDLAYSNKNCMQLVWVENKESPQFVKDLELLRKTQPKLTKTVRIKELNENLWEELKDNQKVTQLVQKHKPKLWFNPVKSKNECEEYHGEFLENPEKKDIPPNARTPILVPVKIIDTPPTSDFDLNRVLESKFFFS